MKSRSFHMDSIVIRYKAKKKQKPPGEPLLSALTYILSIFKIKIVLLTYTQHSFVKIKLGLSLNRVSYCQGLLFKKDYVR